MSFLKARQVLSDTVANLNAAFDASAGINSSAVAGSTGLPDMAAEKLRRARADREDAHILYLRASDAEREARTDLLGAQSVANRQLEAPRGYSFDAGTVAKPAADDKLTARIMAPVHKAESALKAAVSDKERAAKRYSSYDYVPEVEEWLSRFGGHGSFKEVESITPRVKSDIYAAVLSIRSEIAKLTEEIAHIEAAPTPAEVLRAQAYAEIDNVAEQGALTIHPQSRSGSPLRLSEKLLLRTGNNGAIIGDAGSDIWAWLLRDQLKAKVDQMIADLDLSGAMTVDEQDAATRTIAHKRLELERQEEALIVSAEVSGRPVTRRVDLDPRAFLGIDA
ncbi:hypothetical protein [Pseudochrobactrum sp. XF203]|uniref:hypothetical protein n=1 Tax=Pseudochrobactrum sp. XF203 TaxID=2879116 RepID=UPI001CE2754B|nr:hypothetical protein [Pseudochrobactrum sp. XF203]UCA46158.1 hypothetical protein LDL70_02540 [Pseudochrobactrum sp. XF203]